MKCWSTLVLHPQKILVVRSLLANESRLALTGGEQQRDFIYIDDAIAALLCVTRFAESAPVGFYELEVGRGEPTRLRDFVELAKRLCPSAQTVLDFGALPYRTNEVMSIAASTEKLRALGWRPCVSLEEGLRRMIAEEKA